ncbi:hypothetical protein H2200_007689 [Cladophialophora chaetospira]|uniref:Uncharacterized protein n=1 Tax=Cladophialophora chaetospira TaxID=386627 RepID=A0AA38X6C4_9EURO|nr:hypothetical protein H2200_007689 [Cladophialophora chaetospira]
METLAKSSKGISKSVAPGIAPFATSWFTELSTARPSRLGDVSPASAAPSIRRMSSLRPRVALPTIQGAAVGLGGSTIVPQTRLASPGTKSRFQPRWYSSSANRSTTQTPYQREQDGDPRAERPPKQSNQDGDPRAERPPKQSNTESFPCCVLLGCFCWGLVLGKFSVVVADRYPGRLPWVESNGIADKWEKENGRVSEHKSAGPRDTGTETNMASKRHLEAKERWREEMVRRLTLKRPPQKRLELKAVDLMDRWLTGGRQKLARELDNMTTSEQSALRDEWGIPTGEQYENASGILDALDEAINKVCDDVFGIDQRDD